MSGQAMGWDGRPENPERDGWHWLAYLGRDPVPAFWRQADARWVNPPTWGGCYRADHIAGEAFSYHGPAYTRADLLAAQAEGAAAERDKGYGSGDVLPPKMVGEDRYEMPEHGWTCFHCGDTFQTPYRAQLHFGAGPLAMAACRIKFGEEMRLLVALREAEKQITELRCTPVPAQPALDAALERARAEGERQGIERAAEIAESTCWLGYRFTGGGALAKEIRALPPSPALAAADARTSPTPAEDAADA